MSPKFVISLDYELLWGMLDSSNIESAKASVLGEIKAVPKILEYFDAYKIRATWAVVGMSLCENFEEWETFHPNKLPNYSNNLKSSYHLNPKNIDNPDLYFQANSINLIRSLSSQEIASHSFSHLYFNEPGINSEDIEEDFILFKRISQNKGITCSSFIFPRNQFSTKLLNALKKYDFSAYRGNNNSFIYNEGEVLSQSSYIRYIRLIDSYVPLTRNLSYSIETGGNLDLVDIPASLFFRPFTYSKFIHSAHIKRVKNEMLSAAKKGQTFHLWWHPHNFGLNLEENLIGLLEVLNYFKFLKETYDMQSCNMKDLA